MKAVPDSLSFFLTRVKLHGHEFEGKTKTSLKFRIDASLNFEPPPNQKIQRTPWNVNFFKNRFIESNYI